MINFTVTKSITLAQQFQSTKLANVTSLGSANGGMTSHMLARETSLVSSLLTLDLNITAMVFVLAGFTTLRSNDRQGTDSLIGLSRLGRGRPICV